MVVARVHLMHCVPDRRMHGLNGYLEVIQTLDWGLTQLGHQVGYALNAFDSKAVNIIFGAQVLPIEVLQRLPDDSIVYNFEQLRNLEKDQIRPEIQFIAERFEVLEYSAANLQAWRDLGAPAVKIVPVGWAPVISRIAKPAVQDIDVLMYGLAANKRLHAVYNLSRTGMTTMFVSGLYGAARDDLIARSKVILNVNMYEIAQIFEVVRVSYLFANRKAVVATRESGTFVEPDIASAVKFTNPDQLAADCGALVEDEAARSAIEQKGFEVISRRDIREILREARLPL
jgi:hypothetical protein